MFRIQRFVPRVEGRPLLGILRSALSALSMPATAISIVLIIRMALGALGCPGPLRAATIASKIIQPCGHGLQVIWIYAHRNLAKMVNMVSDWDGSLEVFIRKSVCINLPIADIEFGVFPVACAIPNPTRIRPVDFPHESMLGWFLLVVGAAPIWLSVSDDFYHPMIIQNRTGVQNEDFTVKISWKEGVKEA